MFYFKALGFKVASASNMLGNIVLTLASLHLYSVLTFNSQFRRSAEILCQVYYTKISNIRQFQILLSRQPRLVTS